MFVINNLNSLQPNVGLEAQNGDNGWNAQGSGKFGDFFEKQEVHMGSSFPGKSPFSFPKLQNPLLG